MSRILSTISSPTGQAWSHARHVVHAQSSSAVIRSKTRSEETVRSASTLTGGDTRVRRGLVGNLAQLEDDLAGSSALPVWFAGHTSVHRPQIVQASVSKSCFHVNSPSRDAPIVSISVASMRFGTGLMAPFGRVRGARREVHRRRHDVAELGRGKHHEEGDKRNSVADPEGLVPARGGLGRHEIGQRIADERPHLERRTAHERDSGGFGEQTGHADEGKQDQDPGILGSRLRPNRHGFCPYRRTTAHSMPIRKSTPAASRTAEYPSYTLPVRNL